MGKIAILDLIKSETQKIVGGYVVAIHVRIEQLETKLDNVGTLHKVDGFATPRKDITKSKITPVALKASSIHPGESSDDETEEPQQEDRNMESTSNGLFGS